MTVHCHILSTSPGQLADGAPLVVLVIALAAILGVYHFIRESRRNKEFHELAQRLGLRHEGACSGRDIEAAYAPLELLDRGHSRKASHVLTGRLDGCEVMCCAYQYTTGSGKNKSTRRRGLAMLDLGLFLPRILIRHEGFGDRLASWLGFDDVDFESDQFSRRYFVKCHDRRFAYALIDPQMMEFLLQESDFQWEVSGRWVAVWREDELDADEVRPLLNALLAFRNRVPRLVEREYAL